jgi:hypothetical protein
MAFASLSKIAAKRRRAAWLGLALATASFAAATAIVVVRPSTLPLGTSPPPASASALLPSTLDSLREEAALGNADASRYLVTQLVARYDRSREDGALVEAVLWFDRDWSTPAYLSSGVSALLVDRECDHPVLRWHWLCSSGE